MGDTREVDPIYTKVELAAFPGIELIAAYDEQEQRLWLPVATVCSMLGLDARNQRQRVQRDYAEHVEKFTLPTSGGRQELVCLEYEALALWLAHAQGPKTPESVRVLLRRFRAQVMAAASDILTGKLKPVTFDERRKSARPGNPLMLEHDSRLAALERAVFVGEPEEDASDGRIAHCPHCGGPIRVSSISIEAVTDR